MLIQNNCGRAMFMFIVVNGSSVVVHYQFFFRTSALFCSILCSRICSLIISATCVMHSMCKVYFDHKSIITECHHARSDVMT